MELSYSENNYQLSNVRRQTDIDVFRAIGIVSMIMGHVWYGEVFNKLIHAYHMPMFFFVSGLFYHRRGKEELWKYVRHLSKRLLVPYCFFGLVNYVAWFFFSKTGKQELFMPLKSIIWINTQGIIVGGAIWFLTSLFFADLIFALVDTLVKSKIVQYVLIISIAAIGCLLPMHMDVPLPFGIEASFVGVGFIFIGTKVTKAGGYKRLLVSFPVEFFLLLVAALLTYINSSVNMRTGNYGIILLFWGNALVWFWVLINVSCIINRLFNRAECILLVRILQEHIYIMGRDSIVFLGFNQLLIIVVNKVMSHLNGLNKYADAIIYKIFVTLVVIELLVLVSRLLSHKPLCVLIGKPKG